MNPDPMRWAVLKGPHKLLFHIVRAPLSQVEATAAAEGQRLGFETVAVVDSQEEAEQWVELAKGRGLP